MLFNKSGLVFTSFEDYVSTVAKTEELYNEYEEKLGSAFLRWVQEDKKNIGLRSLIEGTNSMDKKNRDVVRELLQDWSNYRVNSETDEVLFGRNPVGDKGFTVTFTTEFLYKILNFMEFMAQEHPAEDTSAFLIGEKPLTKYLMEESGFVFLPDAELKHWCDEKTFMNGSYSRVPWTDMLTLESIHRIACADYGFPWSDSLIDEEHEVIRPHEGYAKIFNFCRRHPGSVHGIMLVGLDGRDTGIYSIAVKVNRDLSKDCILNYTLQARVDESDLDIALAGAKEIDDYLLHKGEVE